MGALRIFRRIGFPPPFPLPSLLPSLFSPAIHSPGRQETFKGPRISSIFLPRRSREEVYHRRPLGFKGLPLSLHQVRTGPILAGCGIPRIPWPGFRRQCALFLSLPVSHEGPTRGRQAPRVSCSLDRQGPVRLSVPPALNNLYRRKGRREALSASG